MRVPCGRPRRPEAAGSCPNYSSARYGVLPVWTRAVRTRRRGECGVPSPGLLRRDLRVDGLNRLVEPARVRAARLGHVRPSTARAADDAGDRADQVARLEAIRERLRDGEHELGLALVLRADQHDAVPETIAQLL